MKINSKSFSGEGRQVREGKTIQISPERDLSIRSELFGLRDLCVLRVSTVLIVVIMAAASSLVAQEQPTRRSFSSATPDATANFSTNLTIIRESQQQALQQARGMLEQTESARDRQNLQLAIREMERSQAALEAAEKSPEKLPGALAAQQNAYQALLKMAPREFRMTRQRNGQSGPSSGQPQRQQMEQLDMAREENRYETERQASATPNPQQQEQAQTADRLKELAQRQQDLNERLRELQTALQAARNEPEREELQRQLKRLRDEQRQMLADADQLKQQMDQSSNAMPEARQQMDQTRSDMQRAAQEMEKGSASGALAAGTRAQQNLQNLRDDLRRQTASQFTEQMRDLRNQSRELTRQEEEIARALDSLANGQKSLNDAGERQQVSQQMLRLQSSLTNLLANLRAVTEQAETSEPLLSKQLYDTLRRTDPSQLENLLRLGAQLTDRGFLPQASEAERSVRTHINQLRQSVERAAESVLGNEAESLRFAQKELEDLTRQVEQEFGRNGTNASSNRASGAGEPGSGTNQLARAGQRGGANQSQTQPGSGTNAAGLNSESGSEQASSGQPSQNSQAQGNSRGQGQGSEGQNSSPNGNSQRQAGGDSGQRGQDGQGEDPGNNSEGQPGNSTQTASGRGGRPNAGGGANGGAGNSGGIATGNRLREIVEQLGREGNISNGGPITGGDYVNWADRLRDVEQILDQPDLRNQVATVRERVGALRSDYRENSRAPSSEVLRNQVVAPLAQVRVWLQQELARQQNPQEIVPLDRDPVPENYSELVRRYYEKLGSAE